MKSIENKEEYSMKDVRITVIRKVCHQDLMALYVLYKTNRLIRRACL